MAASKETLHAVLVKETSKEQLPVYYYVNKALHNSNSTTAELKN